MNFAVIGLGSFGLKRAQAIKDSNQGKLIVKGILEITENKNLSEQLIKKGNEKIQEIINKEEFKEKIFKAIDNYFNIKTLWEK